MLKGDRLAADRRPTGGGPKRAVVPDEFQNVVPDELQDVVPDEFQDVVPDEFQDASTKTDMSACSRMSRAIPTGINILNDRMEPPAEFTPFSQRAWAAGGLGNEATRFSPPSKCFNCCRSALAWGQRREHEGNSMPLRGSARRAWIPTKVKKAR